MGKVYLTSEFTFDAAHRLYNYDGKCSQTHGHTYRLQVTVCGIPNPFTGLLIDFCALKDLVDKHIIDKVDHKNLTDVFNWNTTVENLCIWAWGVLKTSLPNEVKVDEVRLWETPTCHAAYRGSG